MRMTDGDMFEPITKMRHGYIVYNPFVPVIALAWNTERAVFDNENDSGVDPIVAGPIPPPSATEIGRMPILGLVIGVSSCWRTPDT